MGVQAYQISHELSTSSFSYDRRPAITFVLLLQYMAPRGTVRYVTLEFTTVSFPIFRLSGPFLDHMVVLSLIFRISKGLQEQERLETRV